MARIARCSARTGLQHVRHAETYRLVLLQVAPEVDVGVLPEVIQVLPLGWEQAPPAGAAEIWSRGPSAKR